MYFGYLNWNLIHGDQDQMLAVSKYDFNGIHKLQLNSNKKTQQKKLFQGNEFENAFCKNIAILFMPQWVWIVGHETKLIVLERMNN